MDHITIICAVAAQFFHPGDKKVKYEIPAKDLNLVKQAPAWIQNTVLFKLLVADGSLKYVTSSNRIQVENEPTLGMNADGKAAVAEHEPDEIDKIILEDKEDHESKEPEPVPEKEVSEPKRGRKKKDDAQ